MRNRICALLICIHCLASVASAQTSAKRQLVLQVFTGGFISFKSETLAIDKKQTSDGQSLASLIHSQAMFDEKRIIHRVLTDSDNRVIFGYDLLVSSDPLTKKFNISVMPADEAFRRTFMKESATRSSDLFATFPKSTSPQTLDDGDAISLELLVNPESGLKIMDVVRVTFDRSRLIETSPDSPPKDFTLDAVALTVKGYELFIDDNLVAKGRPTVGCSGSIVWFYVPDRGRFIFSLAPREGYSFEKLGVLDGNRIEFIANGEHYEWISSVPILANGGTWNLWVLRDANYTPLFGPQKKKPRTDPGVLDRLNDVMVLKGGLPGLTFRVPGSAENPTSEKNKQLPGPQRVTIGGADNMDNVLPKSP